MVSFASTQLPSPMISLDAVRLSNGVTLHYATQGPRSGPGVVLLHGYADSWFSFSRVLPLLPADLRVVAPDLRGHGDSDRPLLGYRPTDLAGDVIRLLDALAMPKVVVIGHSMGSFVARKVFALAPSRLTRLVLIGAAPTARTATLETLLQSVRTLTDPVDEAFVREFQMSTVHSAVPDAFMEAAIANSRRLPARVWKAALQGLIEDDAALDKPSIRTLVVGGRHDAVFSVKEQMSLARQFPRGELHLVDGVGHAIHWEQPATFVSALIRFGV